MASNKRPLKLARTVLPSILCAIAGSVGTAPTPLVAADPISFTVGHFTFERPEGWAWVNPSSPMRKAELAPPAENGGARPEVTFFHFGPGQGGGVEANIGRWLAQFQESANEISPEIETGMAGQTRVTFVRARGTFLSGMPGAPTKPIRGYALRGAIIEDPDHGDVFVKMTGPEAGVAAAADAFDRMVKAAAASHVPHKEVISAEPKPFEENAPGTAPSR